jgi:hypothetical protein
MDWQFAIQTKSSIVIVAKSIMSQSQAIAQASGAKGPW